METQDLPGAIASYDHALRIRADYVDALYNKGETLLRLDLPEPAKEAYEAALKLVPDHVGALLGLSRAMKSLGALTDALAVLQDTLRLSARDPDVLNNLGLIYQLLERHGESLEAYAEALQVQPRKFESHVGLFRLFAEMGEYEKAKDATRNAIRARSVYVDSRRGSMQGAILVLLCM